MRPEERARGLRVIAEERTRRWQGLVERVDTLAASGAPLRTLLVALSPGLAPTRAFTAVQDWLGKTPRSPRPRTGILLLSGLVGVGKSVAAARYALETGATWTQATALGQLDYARAARTVERLIAAPHLVLDEIGGPGATGPAGIARVSEVLVQRHAAGRPVVGTTNLDRDEFVAAYDGLDRNEVEKSRLLDRIKENGAYVECKREVSFRVEGGIDPDKVTNRYATAKRGVYLVGLLDAGETSDEVLDELQHMLGCSDDDVERASNMSGLTPAVRSQIDALLERLSPGSRRAGSATCGAAPDQRSLGAYGDMEAIS